MAGWATCRNCRGRIWFGPNPKDPSRWLPYDDDTEQVLHFRTCSSIPKIKDETGVEHDIARCKLCGADVWWEELSSGKHRMMDIEDSVFGKYASLESCHWETCVAQHAGQEWNPAGAVTSLPELEPDIAVWLNVLGLPYPSDFAAVRSAFRTLAMQHHPDVGGNEADFIRIRLAFDRCKDLLGEAA